MLLFTENTPDTPQKLLKINGYILMNISNDKIGLENDDTIDVFNLKVRKEFLRSLRKNKGFYKTYSYV